MAETDKRRAVTTRIIWGVIGVFFLIMVISQAMIFFGSSVRTEVATLYTATESSDSRVCMCVMKSSFHIMQETV